MNPFLFEPTPFTLQLCPEAQGHFCMHWGEHGHGGYDSHAKAYIQGGQPLDDGIAILGIYLDFEDAKKNGDWKMMRSRCDKSFC